MTPTNRYAGRCRDCRRYVAAEAGFLAGRDPASGRWLVRCRACDARERRRYDPPPPPAAAPSGLAILGLKPPASPEAIRGRFRELAQLIHPDHGGDEKLFIVVKAAYDEAMQAAGGRP